MSTNQVEKNKTWDVLESMQLKNRIKELEFDCAELQKKNEELLERCKKLASRTPNKMQNSFPFLQNMTIGVLLVMHHCSLESKLQSLLHDN